MKRPRILLSEGSSTNARETITVLGAAGYRVDVCDPDPVCLARFSRFVRRVHRCPVSGIDPIGYLRTVVGLLKEYQYDVLLPVNEQAYLFAWARDLLTPLTGLAVSDFAAFARVQTKTALLDLLDELDLGHPDTRVARTADDARTAALELGFPCYLKTPEGTASVGVWRIAEAAQFDRLLGSGALDATWSGEGLVVQAQASGHFEQAHAVFDHGRLVAVRTDRRLAEGTNGGPALKVGVHRPAVTADLERIGTLLNWHGGFSVDYFWDEWAERAAYIDANPRLTEPFNAFVNGVNLPELQVRLSLGEHPPTQPALSRSASSHALIHSVLGAATNGSGRRGLVTTTANVVARRGPYRQSTEGLTPFRLDPPSSIAATHLLGRLLINPDSGHTIATSTIANYSLGRAIPMLAASTPSEHGLVGSDAT